jgi:hypothetical protein
VDDALDPGAQRLLHDVPCADDVHVVELLGVGVAQRDAAGDVEDAVDALHRPAHGPAVEHVALDPLEVEVLDLRKP